MNTSRFQIVWFISAVIMVITAITACNQKTEKMPEPLIYRLKWLFNISVAGDIWADIHGHFAEQGLQVIVKPGGPERDAIKELELDHTQFGVASADQVIRACSKGSPVKVIAQLFQTNPLQWIYRPDETHIQTPEDLKGKTIGITFGGNDETIMRALLAKYNISETEVNIYSVRYDYTPFYERKVDLWPIYRNAEGIVIGEKLRKAGEQFDFFDPDKFGIRFVANSVVTSEQMLKAHPDIVKKFITALIRGWEEALDPANKEKTVDAVQQFDKDTLPELIKEQLEITRSLIKPSANIEIGKIDAAAWKQTEKIMQEQRLITESVNVENILANGE